jgi:hypothetical protein
MMRTSIALILRSMNSTHFWVGYLLVMLAMEHHCKAQNATVVLPNDTIKPSRWRIESYITPTWCKFNKGLEWNPLDVVETDIDWGTKEDNYRLPTHFVPCLGANLIYHYGNIGKYLFAGLEFSQTINELHIKSISYFRGKEWLIISYNYFSVSVPVGVHLNLYQRRKLLFGAIVGFSYNLMISGKTDVFSTTNTFVDNYPSAMPNAFVGAHSGNTLLGLRCQFQVNKRLSAHCIPLLKVGLFPNRHLVYSTLKYGTQLGITYQLK